MAKTMALKMVVLVVPRGAEEKAMLEEDLRWMGYHGLMLQPWGIKYEKLLARVAAEAGQSMD